MKTNILRIGVVAAAFTVAAPAASVHADAPISQQVRGISYVTGGIGDEERAALEAVKSSYNLRIMSASKSGAFEGDTHLVIRDRERGEIINTEVGPLFYVNLPSGRYVVEASSEGKTRQQVVNITQGKPTQLHFSW